MKTATLLFLILGLSVAEGQTIQLTPFASGFSNPVEITHANDSRLFVVQQAGSIRIVNPDGSLKPNNFLTLGSTIVQSGGESGLLGMAFHPNYATNGYFFVNYTRTGDGATVIARYSVSADADIADPNSALILLTIAQPFSNHNGGTIKFGPDGYLYIGMGDGGSGGDPGNRAQNITENLGKMLRIDVDSDSPYGIPPDNPYVGVTGNDEIWAIGLRNPWKFSFDRSNGDLWIADVGQDAVEEINKLESPIPAGLNLGWRCYEGTVPYNTSQCATSLVFTAPFAEYPHFASGCSSISGGYVYRGSLYPNFEGVYFFADLCHPNIGTVSSQGTVTFSANQTLTGNIVTFGEDMNGELYVNGGNTIYKISDASMGIDDFARNGMRLYPNPSAGEIFLEAPNLPYPVQFQLYDSSGRKIHDQQLENTANSHYVTGELAQGVYTVKLQDNLGAVYSTKLAVN